MPWLSFIAGYSTARAPGRQAKTCVSVPRRRAALARLDSTDDPWTTREDAGCQDKIPRHARAGRAPGCARKTHLGRGVWCRSHLEERLYSPGRSAVWTTAFVRVSPRDARRNKKLHARGGTCTG